MCGDILAKGATRSWTEVTCTLSSHLEIGIAAQKQDVG